MTMTGGDVNEPEPSVLGRSDVLAVLARSEEGSETKNNNTNEKKDGGADGGGGNSSSSSNGNNLDEEGSGKIITPLVGLLSCTAPVEEVIWTGPRCCGCFRKNDKTAGRDTHKLKRGGAVVVAGAGGTAPAASGGSSSGSNRNGGGGGGSTNIKTLRPSRQTRAGAAGGAKNAVAAAAAAADEADVSWHMLHPSSRFMQVWAVLMVLSGVYLNFSATYRNIISFRLRWDPAAPLAGNTTSGSGVPDDELRTNFAYAEFALELLFFIDFLMGFFVAQRNEDDESELLVFRCDLFRSAASSPQFYLDLVTLPMVVLPLIDTSDSPVARFYSILHVLRLAKAPDRVQQAFYYSSWAISFAFVRILKFLATILLAAHIIALTWFFISDIERRGGTVSWVDIAGLDDDSLSLYASSLYFTMTTLTGVGYGDIHATTTREKFFVVCVQLVSSIGFALFVANISTLLATQRKAQAELDQKLASVMAFMRYRKVPNHFQRRVREFYTYAFRQRKMYPFNDESLLDDLPLSLQRETIVHMNRRLVEHVPFFRGRDPAFIRSVVFVLRLRACVCVHPPCNARGRGRRGRGENDVC